MMYSFDVYDTIVTRRVYEPKGIWELMSYCLIRDCREWNLCISFCSDFAHIRSDSEKQARKSDSCDVTIDDIYDTIKNNYNLSDEVCVRLKNLEIECELNNTIIIKDNIEKIKKLQEAGEHIVLISDMYLPRGFFKVLFDRICPLLNEFKLYLSCDIGVTKSSGLMYKYVSEQEGIDYSEWIHEGDNIVSDINIPELYGIGTVLYKRTFDYNMIKRIEDVASQSSPVLQQFLLGMIKNMDSGVDEGYRIGYGFIGIALYAYVEWILDQAKKRNIKELYFIARDGFILKKIADIIIKEYGYDISTHYLYGSRRAWRLTEECHIEVLKRYIKQEFVRGFDSAALIDTQGTGRSIEFLSGLTGHKFSVFYYAFLGSMTDRDIIPICFTAGVGGSMIEVLCRAPHGPTLGYEDKDGKIVPILNPIDDMVYKNAQMFSYFKGIESFARDFVKLDKDIGDIHKGSISENIVRYCLKNPDIQLADFFGNIPFDGENKNEQSVFAPKLTKESIRRIELDRTTEKLETVYTGNELEISYIRLDPDEKQYLRECRQQYIEKTVVRSDDALKIIIYGFGVYGKELYHRMHLNPDVIVVDIVDANHQKFAGTNPIVSPIKNIRTELFDIVVISLYDEKVSTQIKNMLVSVGLSNEEIMELKEFYEKYE